MSVKIKLADFLKNHIISNLKTDASSSSALYDLYTPDQQENRYKKDLMYLNTDDFQVTPLELSFEVDDFFINNGEIILKQCREESTVFYKYSLSEHGCEELLQIPFIVDKFAFDSLKLYFTAEVHGTGKNTSVKSSRRGPFFKEGRGVPGDGVTALFQSDLNGKDISLISSLDMNIHLVDFDFLNERILFTAFKSQGLKPIDTVIYHFNIQDETVGKLFDETYRIEAVQSMSEDLIYFMGVDLKVQSRNENQQIYKINPKTGDVAAAGDFSDLSNENFCIVTDSIFAQSSPVQRYDGYFYFKQVSRDRELLCRISSDGRRETVVDEMKVISSYSVTDKGIMLTGLKDFQLSEVFLKDRKGLHQITHHNKWQTELQVVKAEKMSIEINNVEIDGFVYPPVNIEEGRLYPAVLMIHGGPKMLYSNVFAHDIQLLCANGYYVFNANPMGSDGRGDEFANVRGQFGSLPYEQLMAFTDGVLDKYSQIDRKKLGVSGGSYGGYMTNYIITKTSRFKAAVSERGISNLMTAFTSSEIGSGFVFEYMGNKETPWSCPSSYLEESPIGGAGNVSTPTLFIHGKNDYTCHYTESLNMYSALNYLGVETKFCLFEDEGHGLVVRGKPLNKLRRYKEFLDWFDKYLKNREQII